MKEVIWFIVYVLAFTLATIGVIAFMSWGGHLLSWVLVRWTILVWTVLLGLSVINHWLN